MIAQRVSIHYSDPGIAHVAYSSSADCYVLWKLLRVHLVSHIAVIHVSGQPKLRKFIPDELVFACSNKTNQNIYALWVQDNPDSPLDTLGKINQSLSAPTEKYAHRLYCHRKHVCELTKVTDKGHL